MRYHIAAPNLELSDQQQAGLMEKLRKLERLVQSFPPDAVDVDVTVDRLHRTQDFEISLRLSLTSAVLVSRELAPGLEQATIAAVNDVIDQLERYKAKLRGEDKLAHSRRQAAPEELPEVASPLQEPRELYDRSLTGDDEALRATLDTNLAGVRRVLRRELRSHGVAEGPEHDALFEQLLGLALAEAQQDIARKPSKMSVSGWLGLKVRKTVEEHFRPPQAGGWTGAA